jgi:hypothetical protein
MDRSKEDSMLGGTGSSSEVRGTLSACLADLESRIDEAVEERLLSEWRDFCALKCAVPVFLPSRRSEAPPGVDWPQVRVNETLDDFDRMALQQFRGCSEVMRQGSGSPMTVRCNYGTPIMALLFGAELFIMPDETNTLPGNRPVPGGAEGIRKVLDRGAPSLDHPYLQKVYEMGRRFMSIKARFPKIGRHVYLYHPDLQGPMDILEMVWGSELFPDLYEEPELVHEALKLITETYIKVLREWERIVPLSFDGYAPHWSLWHKGAVMLRDDSAMNLSPAMFEEFIKPYDQRILDEFGGGAIHACGRVDHYIASLAAMPGMHGFNMSQPDLNDMEKVYANTVDRDVVLLNLSHAEVDAALARGRDLRGRVQTT